MRLGKNVIEEIRTDRMLFNPLLSSYQIDIGST